MDSDGLSPIRNGFVGIPLLAALSFGAEFQYNTLGLALARLGKYPEAVRHLEKSLELDDDGSLHYQLARAYQAAGSGEKARAAMAQYQEILKRKQPPQ